MSAGLMNQIEAIIESKSLLKHPFYQGWTKGSVSLEALRRYARQYYHFELAYPTFLSGLHYRCGDRRIRQLLLDNLWDEEHGADNHVELWLRFCEGLGIDREEVEAGEAMASTSELVQTYTNVTSADGLAAGAAALFAYESQVPEVARAKREGLIRHYNVADERSLSFFNVHQTLDEEHSEAERDMIVALSSSPAERSRAVEAVEKATSALWHFLDGVQESQGDSSSARCSQESGALS